MAETPISSSQRRAAGLAGLETNGTYAHAASVLSAAGLPSDGCPSGHDWRSAKKLSDAELTALLVPSRDVVAQQYESAADRNLRIAAEQRQARKERSARMVAWQRGEIAVEDEEAREARDLREMAHSAGHDADVREG